MGPTLAYYLMRSPGSAGGHMGLSSLLAQDGARIA
jgi:hypothetical protein